MVVTALTTIVKSERTPYSIENFGFMFAWDNPRERDAINALRPRLNFDESALVEIDPNLIRYTCNESVIHEGIAHYMQSDELFDNEGWFGNRHPVVVSWKGSYAVLDGNHRVIAARMTGRKLRVHLND